MIGKLLSIGNDSYLNFGQLNGARRDAQSIFTSFTSSEQIYDSNHSICLLDSNKEQIIKSFISLVQDSPSLVTVFFAGHGFSYRNNFYCCSEKIDLKAPSLDGIDIKEIINLAQDHNVKELNIIIDACQAGASNSSLEEVIRSHQTDNLMKLCIFCACLEHEQAAEYSTGGVLTTAILNTLKGHVAGLPINKAYISLFDISDALAPQFKTQGQTPVVSGVNLLGQPLVCKNPSYVTGRDNDVLLETSIYQVVNTELSGDAQQAVSRLKTILFAEHTLNYDELITEVTKIFLIP